MPPKAANSIDTFVAARLRTCRKQLGLSQSDIAKDIGVTFQQIQKYESGVNRISAGRLYQFATRYGIPVQDLFPMNPGTSDGVMRVEKLDEIAVFAATPEGSKLCETFRCIKDSHQRKSILSLIQQMSER
jgi:transcriptional regulator with XRE-family HTH domain